MDGVAAAVADDTPETTPSMGTAPPAAAAATAGVVTGGSGLAAAPVFALTDPFTAPFITGRALSLPPADDPDKALGGVVAGVGFVAAEAASSGLTGQGDRRWPLPSIDLGLLRATLASPCQEKRRKETAAGSTRRERRRGTVDQTGPGYVVANRSRDRKGRRKTGEYSNNGKEITTPRLFAMVSPQSR